MTKYKPALVYEFKHVKFRILKSGVIEIHLTQSSEARRELAASAVNHYITRGNISFRVTRNSMRKLAEVVEDAFHARWVGNLHG